MAIYDTGDMVYRWKYLPVFMTIKSPNKTIEIPKERLVELFIEDNYEEHYFPLLGVTVILDSNTYYDIISVKNECKINLRIDKFYFRNPENNNEKSVPRRFINDTFELILDENTEDMYKTLKEDEYKDNYESRVKDNSNDLTKVKHPITLFLFKSSVTNIKKNVNKVLVDCNISDAVAYLASLSNINNLMMTQPDNINRYEELLIPPMSILKAIEFLDLYYGIYRTGSLIYFGLDASYIIPYNGRCTAYYNGEITTTNIIIPKSTNITHDISMGSLNKLNDKTKNYIVADYTSLDIQNQSISNNYINANKIEAVDSYDDIIYTSENNAINKTEGFAKIVENRTMNPYFANIYAQKTQGKSTVISLVLRDYDIGALTPNKEFNLLFEDLSYIKKYNGRYLLAGASHNFKGEGGYFGLFTKIVLRKME